MLAGIKECKWRSNLESTP